MGQTVKELRGDVPKKVLEPPWRKGLVTRKGAPYMRAMPSRYRGAR